MHNKILTDSYWFKKREIVTQNISGQKKLR